MARIPGTLPLFWYAVVPMPRDILKHRARVAAYGRRKRAEARAAKEAARMATTPHVPDTPVITWPDLDTPALPLPTPSLAPLPLPDLPLDVPAATPFTYSAYTPLTPNELAKITEFHATYMAPPGIGQDRAKLRAALAFAPDMLELLEKQLRLNSRPVNGTLQPDGQEGLQVQRNLEWVKGLLARFTPQTAPITRE